MKPFEDYDTVVMACRCLQPVTVDTDKEAALYQLVTPDKKEEMCARVTVWMKTSVGLKEFKEGKRCEVLVYRNDDFKVAWRPWRNQGRQIDFPVRSGDCITIFVVNGRSVGLTIPEFEIVISYEKSVEEEEEDIENIEEGYEEFE